VSALKKGKMGRVVSVLEFETISLKKRGKKRGKKEKRSKGERRENIR